MRTSLPILLVGIGLMCQAQSTSSPEKLSPVTSTQNAAAESESGSKPLVAPGQRSVEVLSDTHGVDVGPYVKEVVREVKSKWYAGIPQEARQPQLQTGITVIEFAILTDGSLKALRISQASGSTPLDRAAWLAVKDSAPFPKLPDNFRGPYLALRLHFMYNPEKVERAKPKQKPSYPRWLNLP